MSVLQEVFVEQLQDLLHAEGQLVKALPKMAKAAHDPNIKEAFQKHLVETEGHVERLKQVFELVGTKAKAKVCKGMHGLIEEGQEVITEHKNKEAIAADLALTAAAQKVEHYEMAGYNCARAIAERLGNTKAAKLLAQTLSEEEKTDKLLTQLSSPLLEAGREVEPGREAGDSETDTSA
jgi:Mn-containing catalase